MLFPRQYLVFAPSCLSELNVRFGFKGVKHASIRSSTHRPLFGGQTRISARRRHHPDPAHGASGRQANCDTSASRSLKTWMAAGHPLSPLEICENQKPAEKGNELTGPPPWGRKCPKFGGPLAAISPKKRPNGTPSDFPRSLSGLMGSRPKSQAARFEF